MKTYRIEISMFDDSGLIWVSKGTITGKSISRILLRAWDRVNGSPMKHTIRDNTIVHSRYGELGLMRLIEI